MKKHLLPILLLLTLSATAQEREPAIEDGAYTVSLAVGTPNERRTYNPYSSYGPISLTADYQFSKRLVFSAQYSYIFTAAHRQVIKRHIPIQVGNTTMYNGTFEPLLFEQRSSYHTLTAGAEYCYLNRGRMWMACGLGLGLEVPKHSVLYALDSNNVDRSNELFFVKRTHFLYRVRFADMKFRVTKNLGLCAGLGFGLDGALTAGILYKFTGREE